MSNHPQDNMNGHEIHERLELFRLFLYHVVGITYPKATFHRRYKLMSRETKGEYMRRILSFFARFDDEDRTLATRAKETDSLMVDTAEACGDKWP